MSTLVFAKGHFRKEHKELIQVLGAWGGLEVRFCTAHIWSFFKLFHSSFENNFKQKN